MYEKMKKEHSKIEQQIKVLESQIKYFPDGKLICTKNGKYSKWYRSDGKNKEYIPKGEKRLAKQLALKKYLSFQLENLSHEKRAIEFYLKHHNVNASQSEQELINSPGFKELLFEQYTPFEQTLIEWMNASYEKNPHHTDNLIHKTYTGEFVRSKSESIILSALFKHRIPFRYECILQFGKVHIFPDFTIRHPRTGEFFYWENFGIMDDPVYVKKTYSKLQLYTSNGIIPTIQLITTYETKEHPLTSDVVEKIIEHYFLE